MLQDIISGEMSVKNIEQEIINAETLEDLLKCLEKIEEQIWNNKEYEKVGLSSFLCKF